MRLRTILLLIAILPPAPAAVAEARANEVKLDATGVVIVGGRKVFPIGLTMPPPPDAKAPDGRNGFAVLREAGVTFVRSGPVGKGWDAAALEHEKKVMDAAAKHGLRAMPFLRELAALPEGNAKRAARLREVVGALKNHPGLGVWKGADEPEWGKIPPADVERAYRVIREVDPNHPVWIVQAPRGTVQTLVPYDSAYDIAGCDIYPVGYPPGMHSLGKNKEISMVGEYTDRMMEVSRAGGGSKPVWMTLQIAWSGVTKPGKTLRMPTFEQERFMTYQAIAHGARGIIYFGGHLPQAWNQRDRELGWNWTFWENVLGRVVREIGPESELGEALVAEDSKLRITASSPEVKLCVREVGQEIFVLACKREGATVEVKFSGLPMVKEIGAVVYEDPRKVSVKNGEFKDWFGPFEVHVYRFRR